MGIHWDVWLVIVILALGVGYLFMRDRKPTVVVMRSEALPSLTTPQMSAVEFFRRYFGVELDGLNLQEKLFQYNFHVINNPKVLPEVSGSFSEISAEEMLEKYFGVTLFSLKEGDHESDLVGTQLNREYQYLGARGAHETIYEGRFEENLQVLGDFV